MEFTAGQQKAYDLIREGHNVALLAPAGVGKSFLINQIKDEHSVIVAPTGIAALNIGGATAHSLFSLPNSVALESDLHRPAKKAEELFANSTVRRVILDEAPMLRSDMFNLIDARLRKVTKIDRPFGALQVILVGDMFQLSPIVAKNEQELFYKYNKSPWFFNTQAYEGGHFQPALLDEVVRQSDKRQQRILESIRTKDRHWSVAVDRINEMTLDRPTDAIWLCSYNKQVDAMNHSRYKEVKGEEKTYVGFNKGFKPHELPVAQRLSLKIGAKVLIKANSPENGYVNGDQGTIVGFEDKCVWVKKLNGEEVPVVEFNYEKIDYAMGLGGLERKVVASFKQLPIKLGWAISIHAAQGTTLEAANIDFGRGCFSSGQAYVALSRVKDLTKLFINNSLAYSDIIVDPEVQRFYKSLEEKS